ncbi:MAG TPA: hypothetical protein VNJ70_04050 [Thermoanaerobaculia bacterium]|nr:hypothetical protein [Thermoanaerobaculia bacterium]
MSTPAPPKNEPLRPGGQWAGKLAKTSLPIVLALWAWPAVRGLLEGWAEQGEGAGLGRLLLFAAVVLAPWLLKRRTQRAGKPATEPNPAKPLEPT